MKIKALLSTLLLTCLALAKEIPLSEAAVELAKNLPAGGIVTASDSQFSETGNLSPAGVPPEKRLFEIGSITKVFTGLLLAQAVVEKKVTLDTPIATLLGDLKLSDPRVGKITLRQLACHTSGLPRLPGNLSQGIDPLDPYAHYNRELLNQALQSLELDDAPPQEWSYSNLGAGLLGDLLSRLYEKPWEDLVRQKITTPLNLNDTVMTLSDDQKKRLASPHFADEKVSNWHFQALAGAGALRSTASDLVTFGRALLAPESTSIAPALKLLIESRSADDKHGLALGHYTSHGEKIMGHNGGTGGYVSAFEIIPATQKIRVILINNTTLQPGQILALSNGQKPTPKKERKSETLPAKKIAQYPGVYLIEAGALKGSKFTVIQKGEKGSELWGKLSGQQFLRFHAAKKVDRFFLKEVEAEFQFGRTDGKITTLTLFQNGQEFLSRKTDEAPPKIKKTLPITKEEAEEFLGNYQLTPKIKFTITFANQTLTARLTGQPALPVFRKENDRFEYQAVEAALEFERNDDGKITAVKLHQNGIVQRAPRQ